MSPNAGLKTVILAGGFGTRIRDVAADIPKPMIPIGPYPVLLHIMMTYGAAGFNRFIIALGYKGEVIRQYFLNLQSNIEDMTLYFGEDKRSVYHTRGEHRFKDWEVTLAATGDNAMTGARVLAIRRYIGDDETFMVTYGDGVGDVPLRELVDFHHSHGKALTITGVCPPGRFGELHVRNGNEVVGFNEKPQVGGGLISGGFFVCNRRVFDYLDDRQDLVFEQEPIRNMVADGEVRVFPHSGFWHPLDTHRDYTYLNDLWARDAAPWKIWK